MIKKASQVLIFTIRLPCFDHLQWFLPYSLSLHFHVKSEFTWRLNWENVHSLNSSPSASLAFQIWTAQHRYAPFCVPPAPLNVGYIYHSNSSVWRTLKEQKDPLCRWEKGRLAIIWSSFFSFRARVDFIKRRTDIGVQNTPLKKFLQDGEKTGVICPRYWSLYEYNTDLTSVFLTK